MSQATSRRLYSEYRARLAERYRRSPRPSLSVSAAISPPRSFGRLIIEFLNFLRGHRGAIAFSLATLTIATLLRLLPPAATKLVVDYVLTDAPLPQNWAKWLPSDRQQRLLWFCGAAATISLLATAIRLWGRWYATKAVNLVQVAIRKRVFAHALRLPLHRVFQLKSGGASSLVREDAGGVADLIFSLLYNPWQAVLQLVGSLVVLLWVDWRLLLGSLILLPLVYVTQRTFARRVRPLFRDIHAQRQEIDGHTTEVFGGVRVVRTFRRQHTETARFVRNNDLMARQQLYVWWWSRTVGVIWEVSIPLAATGVLLYGGYQVLHADLTLGDLTMFLSYLALLLTPLATLAASAAAFQTNLAGLDRVLDLLVEPVEMPSTPDTLRTLPSTIRGQLTLRDVSFRYPHTERLVLDGVSLDIRSGETVALVGPSGAGKSTLCNLVARFYDPTQGVIELDGIDLRKIPVDAYRSLLAIVEQDVFLFDGTIAENIAYAVRRASQADIESVARAANAHEFIQSLDQGYDTLVGERGVRLSGGQRQRLAIARAMLARPQILILDEATSSLDTASERLIQQSLTTLMRDRTCFVIAHRVSTIVHADRIIMLEEGRVTEIGTHHELTQLSSRYRGMVDSQMIIFDPNQPRNDI